MANALPGFPPELGFQELTLPTLTRTNLDNLCFSIQVEGRGKDGNGRRKKERVEVSLARNSINLKTVPAAA
jgi:hypothetical protein